jgi:hypothetical protein
MATITVSGLLLAVTMRPVCGQEWIEGYTRAAADADCMILEDVRSGSLFELLGDEIRDVPVGTRIRAWGSRKALSGDFAQSEPFEVLAVDQVDLVTTIAVRGMPASFEAGSSLSVCIELQVSPDTLAVGVEDSPPLGWTASDIDQGGAWDQANLKVKWGPFFAPIPLRLCYLVQTRPDDEGEHCFHGAASFDGLNQSIEGGQCTRAHTDDCPFELSPDGTNDCNANDVPDECDVDIDGDVVPDDCDNCQILANADQRDFDADGIGDACDPDSDDDGVPNGADICDLTPIWVAPELIESDGSLLGDLDGDCDVDLDDFGILQGRFTGAGRDLSRE